MEPMLGYIGSHFLGIYVFVVTSFCESDCLTCPTVLYIVCVRGCDGACRHDGHEIPKGRYDGLLKHGAREE